MKKKKPLNCEEQEKTSRDIPACICRLSKSPLPSSQSAHNPRNYFSHLLKAEASQPFKSNPTPPKMKVIAAYLLAVLGGNTNPTADDLKNILGSVGAEADDDRIELLLSEVSGKDITELIASGREKFASVPSGGGAPIAMAAGAGGAAAPADEPKKEEKVEEKEESDEDMGFSLFD
ncbi:60S acidic ribosomal protein P2B-like protein [Cinnamomum micranthum f. kanehirae]|uniref:60S acidic ribosomal protein P2B-like protein n=1 Tax=Cinnamomum micranthum f. kanehirae TaxID=337451 RepID=A0A3S3N148_9MAGN|nr:60S acidic ribosomal protein P2B-like protein [Cinnamomum micranthum f. kanehirae]